MNHIDILVPDLPESVTDAIVSIWHKKLGDIVNYNEILVEIETNKVVLEIPSPVDGILDTVLEDEGTTVNSRQILGRLRVNKHIDEKFIAKSEEKTSSVIQCQRSSFKEQNHFLKNPGSPYLPVEHNCDSAAIQDTYISDRFTFKDIDKNSLKTSSDKQAGPKVSEIQAIKQPKFGMRS